MPSDFDTEEMQMTAAVDRVAVSDHGSYPSPDERREALLRLAEAVVTEGTQHSLRPIGNVLPLIVPPLAAAVVQNVMAEFDGLLESVSDRRRFDADPNAWLASHELPLTDACYDAEDEKTQSDIEFALDRLMGRRS